MKKVLISYPLSLCSSLLIFKRLHVATYVWLHNIGKACSHFFMPPWGHQIHCSIVIPVCLSSGMHRETLHLAVFSLPLVRSLTRLKIYQIRLLFHYKVNIQTAVWATVLVYFFSTQIPIHSWTGWTQ